MRARFFQNCDYYTKIGFLCIFIAGVIIFSSGALSEVSLGDENVHYRFSKLFYETGEKPAYEVLYDNNPNIPRYYFSFPFLWHILLVAGWKIIGRASFIFAQMYHTMYYVLLLAFLFLTTKEIYGESGIAFYTVLLALSVPAVAAFSVLFYLDIPATAVSMITFYLIVKRKFMLSVAGMILMYFTKQNAAFLIPAFSLLSIYYLAPRERIKKAVFALVAVLCVLIGDIVWRGGALPIGSIGGLKGILSRVFHYKSQHVADYLNSYFTNFFDIIKYFGIPFLILLFYYLFLRKYEKKDILVITVLVGYGIFYFTFFGVESDIRYVLPIIPFVSILLGKSFYKLGSRSLKKILILGCALQIILVSFYVNQERTVTTPIKEGYEYIRSNIPEGATIIYPDYAQMLSKTNRLVIWLEVEDVLRSLFWGNRVHFRAVSDGETRVDASWPWSANKDKWYHIAVVKYGDNLDFSVDGKFQGVFTDVAPIPSNSGSLFIGAGYSDTAGGFKRFYGYMDEVRVSGGRARWTEDFLPSSSPYSPDNYTKLLLHGERASASRAFTDSGNTEHRPRGGKSVGVGEKSRFGSASMHQENDLDYLSFSAHEDWMLGSDDFTIDMWVMVTDKTGGGALLSAYENSDNYWVLDLEKFNENFDNREIDYLVIKKKRTYDDSTVKHLGGYPVSFIKKISSFFVILMFDPFEKSS